MLGPKIKPPCCAPAGSPKLTNMLKWRVKPRLLSVSWTLTIREQRRKLVRHLSDNPSLGADPAGSIDPAYGDALLPAQRETCMAAGAFPSACPWTRDELLSDAFLPA
jgi:hypothetical protein